MFRFHVLCCITGSTAVRVVHDHTSMDSDSKWGSKSDYIGARFIDATENAGLDHDNSEASFGANLVDIDNDGDLDLYLSQSMFTNRLFLNTDGKGHFVDITESSGLFDPSGSRPGMFADVNGDGNLDLYQLGTDIPNRLFLGDGRGHFIRQFETGLEDSGNGQSMCLGDVDGDGNIDLFVANNDKSNLLFLNDGTGKFTDATEEAGLTTTADHSSFNCEFADMDNDGDLDLLVTSGKNSNLYYVNDGAGKFVESAEQAGVVGNPPSSGLKVGDFNGDGHLDIFNAAFGSSNHLWMNDGTGHFVDRIEDAGLGSLGIATMAVNVADFDGDGDLDILQGRVNFGYSLYENDGNGLFTDVSRESGVDSFHGVSHAIAVGDVDGDGDLDVYLNSWDFITGAAPHNRLLIQEGEPAYNWLKVRPVKENGHPTLVGAQVRLFVAGTQTPASVRMHADGGHCFGGQDSGEVYFGLSEFPGSNFDVEVRCGGSWITKTSQPNLGDVAPNQAVEAICNPTVYS